MVSTASAADFDPVEIYRSEGTGPALILCEHAASHIPDCYDGLGLSKEARHSHIAWDPGARAVAVQLADALNAPMIASKVSRLIYDCNRPPEAAAAMPERSEIYDIPGNRGLTQAQRDARTRAIYQPFCSAVSQMIAKRKQAGQETTLVTVHSFTPVYHGQPRAVEIGILHDSDSRVADRMLADKGDLSHRQIDRNAPYGPEDGVTHSLKLHGLKHGLPNVMIEIRSDLIADAAGVATLSTEVLHLLSSAVAPFKAKRVDHA